ncbi:MAG: NADH-quinone oxidoreductase subunit J [Propionibacteriaceae bacterium]|jgi:NADH-quinone oxidoreductase subunit J|nr:NADH-quinone oxidoreductase subunit J [Propionibacteriaceae bacterium]
MTGLLLLVSTGQTVAFWICAVLAVIAAVGVIASSRPIYSALCLAVVMVSLAALYASLQAEFLFAVQIIVYTGAVLMLFLFVIMMVGVTTHETLVETLRGHRVPALVAGGCLVVLLALATGNVVTSDPAGLDTVQEEGYIQALAQLIFQRYVIPFEATAALLITAAVAAMVLAHPKRLAPKPDQTTRLRERLAAYAATGAHPGPAPASGVTARHNSMATPALLPDGTVAEASVTPTLVSRVGLRTPEELTGPMQSAVKALEGGPSVILSTPSASPSAPSVILSEAKDLSADQDDSAPTTAVETPEPEPDLDAGYTPPPDPDAEKGGAK